MLKRVQNNIPLHIVNKSCPIDWAVSGFSFDKYAKSTSVLEGKTLSSPLWHSQSKEGFPSSECSPLLLNRPPIRVKLPCNCHPCVHLTEIAAIVNTSIHISPFNVSLFDSFTIATFYPAKTVI